MAPIFPPSIPLVPERALRPAVFDRADLFWPANTWARGTELVWTDRFTAEQGVSLDKWEADHSYLDLLWQTIEDPAALDLLAACLAWGTVTVEQALAITGHHDLSPVACGVAAKWSDDGHPAPWASMPRSVRRLFGAGLIERGRPLHHGASMPVAIRPLQGRALKALRRQLDPERLAWVLDRRTPRIPATGDRQSLLATELGLKLAEGAEIAAVLGPRAAGFHELNIEAGTKDSRRSADLVVVLHNGMRIAIEVTDSPDPIALRERVEAWVNLLEKHPHSALGLKVIFVDAADPVRRWPEEVWNPLTRLVGLELADRPHAVAMGVSERILVTRWQQWMPRSGEPTLDLQQMLCLRWSKGQWRRSYLGRDLDTFQPRHPQLFGLFAADAKESAACPAVLRRFAGDV